ERLADQSTNANTPCRAALVDAPRPANPRCPLPHGWLERITAASCLLFSFAVIRRHIVGVEPCGLFGSELDFQIAAENLRPEDMRTRLNGMSTDPQHDVAARWHVDRLERHAAVGNCVHRAFGLFRLDAFREEAHNVDVLCHTSTTVLDVDFV